MVLNVHRRYGHINRTYTKQYDELNLLCNTDAERLRVSTAGRTYRNDHANPCGTDSIINTCGVLRRCNQCNAADSNSISR